MNTSRPFARLRTLVLFFIIANPAWSEDKHSQHGSHDTGATEHLHHEHGVGTWMFEYRFMRMNMSGNLDGTQRVSSADIFNSGYDMAPVSMEMSMHMLMAMYGLTERLTLMTMFNYVSNAMEMETDPASNAHSHGPMKSSGPGDTGFTAMFKLSRPLIVSLGINLPTGSIDEKNDEGENLPFAMQLGSGTFDLRPAITLNANAGQWAYGGQATYTHRLGSNANDYALGNRLDGSAWLKYRVKEANFVTSRVSGSYWQAVNGSDTNMIEASMSSAADPHNQGGTRVDVLFGLSGMSQNGVMFGLEFGAPVYQNLNGPQMKLGVVVSGSLQLIY